MNPARRTLMFAALWTLAACQPAAAPVQQVPATSPTPATTPAAVDAVQEVKASMNRFLSARSFHARMVLEGGRPMASDMDYVAPDRYRITLPTGTQTVIGDTLYMELHGRVTQVPLPRETLAPWRDPLKLQQAQAGLSAERVGSDTVDGKAATRYRVRHAQPQATEFDYWIGPDGLPLQLRHAGTDNDGRPYTLLQTYSRYNDPTIAIDLPR
ncbi:hypothetical protein [Pseudoxanthomonas putridarboris]|uniref:Outer membrane lipoprotein-sorting protein n=1 Tax=Pseudoxanthomonas putridarboris TaxID=752605 RepID=A0ABU9IVI7_9GAMM